MKCLGSCSGYCNPMDVTQCLGCAEGFQLEDNECVRCPEGCTDCFEGECFECLPRFYLDIDDDGMLFCAEECLFPCSDCNDNGACYECLPGFALTDGKCRPDLSCNPDCDYCPPGTFKENVTNEC